MKLIVNLLFIILTAFPAVETSVYICGSTGAKKYHYSESCRGLNACKHTIVKVSLNQAQGYGLELCGWED